MSSDRVRLIQYKISDYKALARYQEKIVSKIIAGQSSEIIILTEHNHVYTIGPQASLAEVIKKPLNVDIISTRRGGRVTYHGQGQLIVYPIINLLRVGKDIRRYIYLLEETIIASLSDIGLSGERSDIHPGVWIGKEKIASLGIRIRRWISFHGLAININPRLDYFNYIIPCGVPKMNVTSIWKKGITIKREDFEKIFLKNFTRIFNINLWGKFQNG